VLPTLKGDKEMNYCVKHKCDFSQAAIWGCPFCEKDLNKTIDKIFVTKITDAIRISYLATIKKMSDKEYRENLDKEIIDYFIENKMIIELTGE